MRTWLLPLRTQLPTGPRFVVISAAPIRCRDQIRTGSTGTTTASAVSEPVLQGTSNCMTKTAR